MRTCMLAFAFCFGIRSLPLLPADEPASQSFDANGVKIHFLTAGEGAPVILIHGLHSSAALNWQVTGIIKELAKDHHVIALDLPGHGRSDKPERPDAYGLQVVEDVILVLDHLRIKQAHVAGYSLGGMVAAKLTATHPDRVQSLMLGGMGWLREGSGLQKFWERVPARQGAGTPTAFIHGIGKLALTEEELKKIDVPVKVLIGDRDPVKQLYVLPLKQVRKDWPVFEISDAGHVTCILKEQFRAELVGWINTHNK